MVLVPYCICCCCCCHYLPWCICDQDVMFLHELRMCAVSRRRSGCERRGRSLRSSMVSLLHCLKRRDLNYKLQNSGQPLNFATKQISSAHDSFCKRGSHFLLFLIATATTVRYDTIHIHVSLSPSSKPTTTSGAKQEASIPFLIYYCFSKRYTASTYSFGTKLTLRFHGNKKNENKNGRF